MNKDSNFYDTKTYGNKIPLVTSNNKNIKVSLADLEYSRSCFYMKDCEFKCNGDDKKSDKSDKKIYANVPITKFNFEKDVEEYKNLIYQLIQNSFNLKIENLKNYLKGSLLEKPQKKSMDLKGLEELDEIESLQSSIFDTAIQEIINIDNTITDKFGRNGKIILAGEYLRFIPEGNTEYNMSIQKQQMKPSKTFSQIDLKEYISTLSEKHKIASEFEMHNYDEILSKSLIKKTEDIFYGINTKEYIYNVKLQFDELLEIIFTKLIYSYKLIIIKTLLEKMIMNETISNNEKKLKSIIKYHIIYLNDIFPKLNQDKDKDKEKDKDKDKEKDKDKDKDKEKDKDKDNDYIKNIYGFIIQNEAKLELFELNQNNKFVKTLGNLNTVIEYKKKLMNNTPYAQLYGFLKYEKQDLEPVFKITDIVSKGDKKSVKGLTCKSKTSSEIKKTLNKLDDRLIRSGVKYNTRVAFCNDAEVLLRRNDTIKKNGKKWFYNSEQHYIMFEHDM